MLFVGNFDKDKMGEKVLKRFPPPILKPSVTQYVDFFCVVKGISKIFVEQGA
jgi:hypothetical protein